MYICVCHAVTDTHIREAVEAGAKTLRDLRTLGVTSECGRCASCARLPEAGQCLRAAETKRKVTPPLALQEAT